MNNGYKCNSCGDNQVSQLENVRRSLLMGGIVFDHKGRVLMRSPSGHWGGYEWTFAKGGAELTDRNPEETALREVQEETGYLCRIVAPIPGEFASERCVTKYFLMEPIERAENFDKETQEVKWFGTAEAFDKISLTRTEKGKERDRKALLSAINARNLLIDE
jgi:8-oxo-dGTP pyrophosphatase MutT (NUDIX family)